MKGCSVLMLLDSYYPSDLRLEKEIDALQHRGFQVTLVCYRRKNESRFEEIESLKLLRTKQEIDYYKKGWIDLYNAAFYRNSAISEALKELKESYDIVHVHDLPLANTGLRYAQKNGNIAVLDLHENYPEALKIWFTWRKNPLVRLKNRVFFNYSRWHKREKKMVHQFDWIIAVVDEMKERLVKIHNLEESKIRVVSNTEPKDLFLPMGEIKESKSVFQIVYVGGIGPHRGLQIAIEAMPAILQVQKNVELLIVGSGNADTISYLQNLVSKFGIENHVRFLGRLPFKEALGYMRRAGMNIIPHLKNDHTDHTIPHKLFQIMNSEFPLLVSSCKPLKRIVEEYDAGLVFEAGSPANFAEKVIWAIHNPRELQFKARNAHNAVQNRGLNWETDGKTLTDFYSNLIESI